MLRLLAALVASTAFVPVALPDEGACEAPGALACVVLAPTDGAVRVTAAQPATYVVEDAAGLPLASGAMGADGMIVLPPGAARLVVLPA